MKKFQSIQKWLNESKKEEPTYGCVMMDPEKIKDWEKNHLEGILEEDIYEDPSDDSYGLEEEPHITVLYGIHEDEIDPTVIVDMMEQKMEPVVVQISEIDIFENKDYDVVKYNVPVTKQLKKYRDMFIKAFENTQTYPDYHPHMTIAYVKKGTGKKYKKKLDTPFEVRFNKAVYSYHKEDAENEELTRRVVNLEPDKAEKLNNDIINSKPLPLS